MRKQSGIALLSVLLGILGVVFIIRIAIAAVPMYLQDRVISEVLTTLHSSGEVGARTRPDRLRDLLERRLRKEHVDLPLDAVEIHRTKGGLVLLWQYESRSSLFANIEIVGNFKQQKDFTL